MAKFISKQQVREAFEIKEIICTEVNVGVMVLLNNKEEIWLKFSNDEIKVGDYVVTHPDDPTDRCHVSNAKFLAGNDPVGASGYIKVLTNIGEIAFNGFYLPHEEKENWHYYMMDNGTKVHVRKDKMVGVVEDPKPFHVAPPEPAVNPGEVIVEDLPEDE